MSTRPLAPDSPTLLLVPTELERRRLHELGGLAANDEHTHEACCGFGPVAAAARTAGLIATLQPARVLLVGIAGTFDVAQHPLGSALRAERVVLDGVGAGSGPDRIAPSKLGFAQWDDPQTGEAAIHEELVLGAAEAASSPLLLTTCAASLDETEASDRRERFPDAAAEDMEGFGVALACALAGVPLCIVRGISNEVGERDSARWRVGPALAAARERAREILDTSGTEGNWYVPGPA